MLDIIQQLLVLQDRDRQVIHHRHQLNQIGPERQALLRGADGAKKALEEAKNAANALESQRKELELQETSKEEQIRKYSAQQLETKKNEEYKALANEIETCQKVISGLQDQQLEILEKIDQATATIKEADATATAAQKLAKDKVGELGDREGQLKTELTTLEGERAKLAAEVEPSILAKYERLLKFKGENSVVASDRSVCAGCHVSLPVQIMIQCQAQKEVVHCPNCSRILYFADGMSREPR